MTRGGVDQPSLFAFASTARSTSYTTAHRITVEQDNIPSVNESGKGAQATVHCLQGLLHGPLVSTNYTHWVTSNTMSTLTRILQDHCSTLICYNVVEQWKSRWSGKLYHCLVQCQYWECVRSQLPTARRPTITHFQTLNIFYVTELLNFVTNNHRIKKWPQRYSRKENFQKKGI